MKQLFQAKALLAALVLSTAVHAADDKKINVNVLNVLIDKIVQEALKDHRNEPNPVFKAVELKLDEKETDLNSADLIKAKLKFSATAEKTYWYAGDTKLSLAIGAGADRKKSEAWLDLSAGLETDTASLARFAAREIKVEFCNPRTPGPVGTDAIVKEVCTELTKIENMTEVGPLFASLHKIATLQVQYVGVEIAANKAKLVTTPDNQKQWIQQSIARQENEQQIAQRIADELKRASITGGAAKVRIQKLELGKVAEMRDFDFYMDKGKIELSLRIIGTNATVKELDSYFQMKPIIEEEILKLQNGDADSVKSVRQTVAWLLKGAKRFLAEGK